MWCNANIDSMFALMHLHFALFRIFAVFFAYFVHFSHSFHSFLVHYLTVKYRPKRWKQCENAKKNAKSVMQMRMQIECKKKKVRCDGMSFDKK
jgi:hypothetical protein